MSTVLAAPVPGAAAAVQALTGAAAGDGPDGGSPAGRGGPRLSRYAAAFTCLLVVQTGVALFLAHRSYFFADDFFYYSILTSQPLTVGLSIHSWFGHLVPGFIAADWTFYKLFGSNWAAATVVIAGVQLGGTVALVRLLTALRGRRWTNLGITALVVLSLVVSTQSLWWGAILTNLVPLAASVATMGCFARWVTRRRPRHLLAMAVMFGIAVAFYEKSVLTAAYVGLLSVLVVDAGLPWRERWKTTLRRWPAWALLGLIAALDLAMYARGGYVREAGPAPGLRSLGSFLLLSFPQGLVPSLFGVRPAGLVGASGIAILVLTNAVVLTWVVWSSVRSRVALQGWIFFGLGYLLNQGVLGRGRLSMLGVHMGTLLRYQLEDVFLFGIALAVSLCAATPLADRLARGPVRWRWTGGLAAVAVVAGLAVPWSQGVRAEILASAGAGSRSYVTTLRTSYAAEHQRDPRLGFLAGDTVPPWLVYTGFAPFNRFDRVFPQVLPEAQFSDDSDTVLAVTDSGAVRRMLFVPQAEAAVSGQCVASGGRLTVALPRTLPAGQWSMRMGYRSTAAATVTVTVDNDVLGPDLRIAQDDHALRAGSAQLVAVVGALPVRKVTVQLLGTGSVCLDSLQLGTFGPA